LLRGLPIQLIAIVLGGTGLLTLLLSTLAILLASLGRNRMGQVGLMLILVLVVFPSNFAWASLILSLINEGVSPESWEAWAVLAATAGFCLSYAWLGIQAAAARIGFAADNHSTSIRWTLLLQQFAFVWVFTTTQVMTGPADEAWIGLLSILAIHWAVAGTFMVGEQGAISPRARRTLPKSIETRQLLTWFNPGSGTGYVFAILSYAAVVIYMVIVTQMKWSLNIPMRFQVYAYGFMCLGYLALYLGLARLILLMIGRFVLSRMVTSVTLVSILIIFGALIPVFVSYWSNRFQNASYEIYMFPNLFWSLIAIDDSVNRGAVFLLGITAAIVFQTNLLFLTRDVMLVRVETPPRVRQERNEPEAKPEGPVDPFAI
jgi:hypothetical protein